MVRATFLLSAVSVISFDFSSFRQVDRASEEAVVAAHAVKTLERRVQAWVSGLPALVPNTSWWVTRLSTRRHPTLAPNASWWLFRYDTDIPPTYAFAWRVSRSVRSFHEGHLALHLSFDCV
jgi:hypothetical protein